MTLLLCACAVITLETQKCRKGAPRSVEFNFFINCDRQKRFSQNERRRADLQNIFSDFLTFAKGLNFDLSKFSDYYYYYYYILLHPVARRRLLLRAGGGGGVGWKGGYFK